MKTGLGIALVVTWMLLAAWIAGPTAGTSFIVGIWALGLATAGCVYRVVAWCLREAAMWREFERSEAPHHFVDRVGALSGPPVFTGSITALSEDERQERRNAMRARLDKTRSRGPARIGKGAA